MSHLPGPYVLGTEDISDMMSAPEGGKFVAIDAPAANHYAFAVVVVQVAGDAPDADRTNRLEATARLLAASPELLAAANAAVAYDKAINACGNSPATMSSFCTAQGESLDSLYDEWIAASHAAIAKVAGITA